ncbi:hypothetical protein MOC16_gp362 [Klebsiella phage vB_KpM_FBKp24]|uniref:Uncharacterized protein n=2 Tax=root TaxID=1 RepID=A0A7U0J6V9_9CAUD|nr:hypothetical protein MOC16_gp362 [Klebsiella phage vB_KpM_FBKp24]QQV92306.1 hypothetical protein vBKpMFBKp24_051 [Klebsiella phage vB_KpM_FBKp24]
MITYLSHLFKVEMKELTNGVKSISIEADDNFHVFELSKISTITFNTETSSTPYQRLIVVVDGVMFEYRHRAESGFNPSVKAGFQKLFSAKFGVAPR